MQQSQSQAPIPDQKQFEIKQLIFSYKYFEKNKQQLKGRIDNYVILQRLGKGATAYVYKAVDIKNKMIVALKIIDKRKIQQTRDQNTAKKLKLIQSEGLLMMSCDSEHVVKCYDIFENKELKILVTQYCNGGTLEDEIKSKGSFSQAHAKDVMIQLVFGLACLHDLDIIHRDLKPANIFIHNGIYKIGDLGYARTVQNISKVKEMTPCGTPTTWAPQVQQGRPYSANADSWSLGAIFYMMICSFEKRKGQNSYRKKQYKYRTQNIKQMAQQGKFNILLKGGKSVSDQVKDFFKKTLVINSEDRIHWGEMLKHKIFAKPERISSQIMHGFRSSIPNSLEEVQSTTDKKLNQLIDLFKNIKLSQNQISFQQINQTIRQEANKIIVDLIQQEKNEKKEMNQMIMEIQKCELIVKDIIIPIEQSHSTKEPIFRQDAFTQELIYLLSSRAFIQLSFFKARSEQNNRTMSAQYFENFDIDQLYQIVQKKLHIYAGKISEQKKKILNIIISKIKKIWTPQKEEKKKIYLEINLDGEQLKQQIKFTYSNYIKPFLPNNINRLPEMHQKVFKLLKRYQEINSIQLEDLESIQFLDKIQMFLQQVY